MRIEIHRNETSAVIIYKNAINAYTKGPMYCVLFDADNGERKVHKYPLTALFRVVEPGSVDDNAEARSR